MPLFPVELTNELLGMRVLWTSSPLALVGAGWIKAHRAVAEAATPQGLEDILAHAEADRLARREL